MFGVGQNTLSKVCYMPGARPGRMCFTYFYFST